MNHRRLSSMGVISFLFFFFSQVNCHIREIVWARIASIRESLYVPYNQFWFDGIHWMRFGFAIHLQLH